VYLYMQLIDFYRYGFKTDEQNGGKRNTPKRVQVDQHTTHIRLLVPGSQYLLTNYGARSANVDRKSCSRAWKDNRENWPPKECTWTWTRCAKNGSLSKLTVSVLYNIVYYNVPLCYIYTTTDVTSGIIILCT